MRRALTIMLVALAGAMPVHAAPEPGATFRDWVVACETLPDDQGSRCFIAQNITLKETGQRLLHIAFGHTPQDNHPAAILTLPLGIFLPAGIAMAIDDGDPRRFAVHHCIAAGCRAILVLDEALIAKLKAGRRALVSFQDANRREIGVPVSLMGFTAGFDSLQE